jgi:hypothetical protein
MPPFTSKKPRARVEYYRVAGDLMVALGFGLMALYALQQF